MNVDQARLVFELAKRIRQRYPGAHSYFVTWAERMWAIDYGGQGPAIYYRSELQAWEAALVEVYGEQDYL